MRILISLLLCAAAVFAGEQTGRRAPGWALPDSNFKFVELEDFRGKVIVLEFMQTSCEHCATFAPVLEQVQKKYAGRVQVISVANAGQDDKAKVERFAAGHKLSYPILLDQGQMEVSYVRKIQVSNPTVFLLDQNLVIRDDFSYGPLTKSQFEAASMFRAIDQILAQKPWNPTRK